MSFMPDAHLPRERAAAFTWREFQIRDLTDIRDVILSLDRDEDLRSLVTDLTFRGGPRSLAIVLDWLLHVGRQVSPGEVDYLGAIDRERLELALAFIPGERRYEHAR